MIVYGYIGSHNRGERLQVADDVNRLSTGEPCVLKYDGGKSHISLGHYAIHIVRNKTTETTRGGVRFICRVLDDAAVEQVRLIQARREELNQQIRALRDELEETLQAAVPRCHVLDISTYCRRT